MDFKFIKFEKKGQIGFLTLNRPEVGNAAHAPMNQEVIDAFNDANKDENIRVVVMTGAGEKFFTAGADAKAMTQGISVVNPPMVIPEDLTKPVICAINGTVAGGGWHYICQSDFSIAADHAQFLEPHVSINWLPLSEMVGMATRAPLSVVLRMALMGTKERMNAERAYQLGIITEVVPMAKLMPRATEIAQGICEQAPLAVAAIRQILHHGFEYRSAKRDVMEYGRLFYEKINNSEDHKEGPRAFAEKRKPVWKGR